jgi:hypothetical protein
MVHLALVAGMPLARALDRWWTADLAAAVGWAGAQALVPWYAAVIALVAIAVQLTWLAATARVPAKALTRRAMALAAAAAIGAALLWPLAAPFFAVPIPALDELRRYSLDWRWYLTPPCDTWLGALLTGTAGYSGAWGLSRLLLRRTRRRDGGADGRDGDDVLYRVRPARPSP